MGNGNNAETSGFTGGAVSGASSNLYDDGTSNVSVSIAAPIGEIVGQAGGYDHPNYTPENVNIFGFEGKVLGLGGGVNAFWDRDSGGPSVSIDASAGLGGTVTVTTGSWNPLDWGVSTNGYP